MARIKHKFFMLPDQQIRSIAERLHLHNEITCTLAVEVLEYRKRHGPLRAPDTGDLLIYLEHEIR